MYRAIVFACVVLAGVAMNSAARADSISELLEKGIYTEETAGDLDKAIAIYEKVVAEAKAGHLLAAQAQYRLGQCLLKKGRKAEATAAFEKLISAFPDAKDLVAKARKLAPGGLPLGPVPWVDGEVLQLRFRMPTGMDIGSVIYTVQSAELDGRKVWRVWSRTFVSLAAMNGMSQVDADWETFRPIESVFKNSLLGTCTMKYSPNKANISIEGVAVEETKVKDGKELYLSSNTSTGKDLDLTRVVYDNEQAMDAMRRLPLDVGYKVALPLMGELGVGEISIPIDVQAKEEVTVPAGRFECFKIHLGLVNQTFWYATDPHRYLVKFSANGVDADLISIGQNKPGELRPYTDDKLGFSLAAPNDWYFSMPTSLEKKHAATVHLLDPQAIAKDCYLSIDKLTEPKTEQVDALRAWADAGLDEARQSLKDFKVRPESWQQRTVGGLPALSVIADYTDGKHRTAEYQTRIEAKSAGLRFKFVVAAPPEKLDDLRKSFDTIIDSLKVKQP